MILNPRRTFSMKLIFLMFLCLFLTGFTQDEKNPSNPPLQLQGDWESSGGDGVICFSTKEEKEQNEKFILEYNLLEQIPSNISFTIEALESYEAHRRPEDSGFPWWKELHEAKGPKNSDEIITLVLNRIRKYVPVFAQKLDLTLEHIHISKWQPSKKEILNIDDSTPIVPITDNCLLVQLADRQTQSQTANYLPKARVFFREDLHLKMNPLDQALLRVHEALYLIGKESNHTNSDDIRKITRFLFSEDFNVLLSQKPYFSQNAHALQGYFIQFFGDYIRFFVQEDFYNNPKDYSDILHANNYTRHHSFVEMNSKMREFINQCLNQGNTHYFCADKIMLTTDLKNIYVNTDEKAFLFLINYFFDPRGNPFSFSEQLYVIDPKNPQEQDDNIQLFLGATCGIIEGFTTKNLEKDLKYDENNILLLDTEDQILISESFKDQLWLKDFILPSLLYCKDIRIALRTSNVMNP